MYTKNISDPAPKTPHQDSDPNELKSCLELKVKVIREYLLISKELELELKKEKEIKLFEAKSLDNILKPNNSNLLTYSEKLKNIQNRALELQSQNYHNYKFKETKLSSKLDAIKATLHSLEKERNIKLNALSNLKQDINSMNMLLKESSCALKMNEKSALDAETRIKYLKENHDCKMSELRKNYIRAQQRLNQEQEASLKILKDLDEYRAKYIDILI